MPQKKLLSIFFILCCTFCQGQTLVISAGEQDMEVVRKYLLPTVSVDSVAHTKLAALLSQWQKEGYFTAHWQEARLVHDTLYAHAILGEKYEWALLHPGNLDIVVQDKIRFREKFFAGRPFHYSEVAGLIDRLLRYAENTGYPFATVNLSNTSVADHQVYAEIDFQTGPKIRFGRLQVKGEAKIKSGFLEAYLHILPGSLYDERKVRQIPDLLQKLPFLASEAPVEVTFQNETADVIVYLSGKASSSADGLINFLPAEGESHKLLLTGALNLELDNLWQQGKALKLQWQRLQVASQRLVLNYHHTRIFRLPLDVVVHFNMLKEDTLFYNRHSSLETVFPSGMQQFVAGIGWQSSRWLTEDALSSEGKTDFDLFNILLGWRCQKTDHQYYPRNGYQLALNGSWGSKKMMPVLQVVPDETGWAPPRVTRAHQQALLFTGAYYQKIGKNWLLFHRLSAASLLGDKILVNDLYRLGGLHSLRGFYDNFFFTPRYGLSNLELRLLFEQTKHTYSHLFVFYDQAYMLGYSSATPKPDDPMGVGAGVSLNTAVGAFSLVYGLGRSASQPFSSQQAKVHFGYVSRF